ncbi:MAG: M43 family zinc metalloprotease [Candidatus Eisenbacteria bacterium]
MKARVLLGSAILAIGLASFPLVATTQEALRVPDDLGGGANGSELFSGRACATIEPTAEEQASVGSALKAYALQYGVNAVGGQIKVAWHVIYSGSTGNIPQSQIDASIAELNKAYSGFYGGVNTGYTFVLASVDRTSSKKWFGVAPGTGIETQMKNALAIDPAHRMNVYSCKPGQNLLGWAYFPNSYPESNKIHGVVIHYGSVPGGYLAPYDLGGTLDHEAGHYLGLYHTFQGGCTAPGDQVDDTPYQATSTSGCPSGKDTCPSIGLDPIHNYMDYSTDICYTEFTAGQDVRMDAMVPTYRPSLLNAALMAEIGAQTRETNVVRIAPQILSFQGAAPNPFRNETELHFALPKGDHVNLRVYNVAGQLVATLVDGEMPAGQQSVRFAKGMLAPGMYFTALRVGRETLTRSVILVN